jgi:hypothetical protein
MKSDELPGVSTIELYHREIGDKSNSRIVVGWIVIIDDKEANILSETGTYIGNLNDNLHNCKEYVTSIGELTKDPIKIEDNIKRIELEHNK